MKKLFLNFCVIFELICSCLLILVSVYSFFLSEEPAAEGEIYYPIHEEEVISADSLVLNDSGMWVSVYDKGLKMWQGSYLLPLGWQVHQDVSTDTLSGDHYDKFNLSFHGPEGEIIKSLGYSLYNQIGNRRKASSFEEEWQSMFRRGVGRMLDTYELSDLTETAPHMIHYLSPYLKTDSSWGYMQAHIRGQKDKRTYEGIVRIINISPGLDWLNNFCMSVTICPKGLLQRTLETEAQIASSYEANPAFERAKYQRQEAYLQGNSVFSTSLSLK